MNEKNLNVFIDFGSSKIRMGIYNVETSKNFEEALKRITSKEKKIICIFGSLYLCGNILNKN